MPFAYQLPIVVPYNTRVMPLVQYTISVTRVNTVGKCPLFPQRYATVEGTLLLLGYNFCDWRGS